MPYQAVVYRVMIASPSDVATERRIVSDLIHEWNSLNSMDMKLVLLPVLWETHAFPQMGDHPQSIVNKQILTNSDILVGVFWTRIGSPTREEISGTVEEINRFRAAGRPVLLYFSELPIPAGELDRAQYEKVQEFRSTIKEDGLFSTYQSTDRFRDLFRNHLASTIAAITRTSGSNPTFVQLDKSTTEESVRLRRFLEAYDSMMRRLEAAWTAERDASELYSIDPGKLALKTADSALLNLVSLPAIGEHPELGARLGSVIKDLRQLLRHQTYLDGGLSFRAFWSGGDHILAQLREVREFANTLFSM
ncbi:MAG: DUF4062 domain-containing protein [Dehalococcoidia bacterium]